MNAKQLASIGILVAMMSVGPMTADASRPTVKVHAKVRTPIGVVRVNTHPPVRHVHRVHRPVPHVQRVVVVHEVTRHDRRVAGRLADYTGVSKREILRLRKMGYRWSEIGMWLEVPRHTVQAAMHGDSWARYMRRQVRLDYDRAPRHDCEYDRHGDRYDDDRDWDERW